MTDTSLAELFKHNEQQLLAQWLEAQRAVGLRLDLIDERTVQQNSQELLKTFTMALAQGARDFDSPAWKPLKSQLERLSLAQARQGFSPSETATFIFSLKEPLFTLLQQQQPDTSIEAVWQISQLIDQLGLFSLEYFMTGREAVIREQQESLLELSTPVVELWDGVLAVPLIGGVGTGMGPLVGAALYVGLREFLQIVAPGLHLVIVGLLILLVVLYLRDGVAPAVARFLRQHLARPGRAS